MVMMDINGSALCGHLVLASLGEQFAGRRHGTGSCGGENLQELAARRVVLKNGVSQDVVLSFTVPARGSRTTKTPRALWFLAYVLKQILQCELQDSRRLSEPDLPERVGIIHRERVAGSAGARDVCSGCSPTEPCRYEAVRQIERFGSNFQLLHLVNVERSGQSRIQRPRAWAGKTVPAHVAVRAGGRDREGRRVDPLGIGTIRSVLIRIRQYLVRPLQTGAAKRVIGATDDIDRSAG